MCRLVLFFFLTQLALSGCAAFDNHKEWSAETFYSEASAEMEKGNYPQAIALLEELQGQYPYGRYTEQAQLDIAYAYYKHEEPAMALTACDRFIRQYPTHTNADYAYYLKGLVNFNDKKPLAEWLLGSDDYFFEKDAKAQRDAYSSFKELVDRFPDSRYADDARARVKYLYDAQAHHEINVARFYFKQGSYVAAVNRAKYTIENYPRTTAIEDALGISALAYKKMGLIPLSEDMLRVLAKNFPASHYLSDIKDL